MLPLAPVTPMMMRKTIPAFGIQATSLFLNSHACGFFCSEFRTDTSDIPCSLQEPAVILLTGRIRHSAQQPLGRSGSIHRLYHGVSGPETQEDPGAAAA